MSRGAAHAADGYARATGKVGVVISTSGPGATNLVTGIATACLDSVPIVAICGNVPTTQIGTDSFQEIDITGVTLPITKHNYFVGRVEELADTIREAFALAASGRPGPVLIDVPKDVQIACCDYEPQPPAKPEPPKAAKEIRIKGGCELYQCRSPSIHLLRRRYDNRRCSGGDAAPCRYDRRADRLLAHGNIGHPDRPSAFSRNAGHARSLCFLYGDASCRSHYLARRTL